MSAGSVWLIDDAETDRRLFRDLLEGSGYRLDKPIGKADLRTAIARSLAETSEQ